MSASLIKKKSSPPEFEMPCLSYMKYLYVNGFCLVGIFSFFNHLFVSSGSGLTLLKLYPFYGTFYHLMVKVFPYNFSFKNISWLFLAIYSSR